MGARATAVGQDSHHQVCEETGTAKVVYLSESSAGQPTRPLREPRAHSDDPTQPGP